MRYHCSMFFGVTIFEHKLNKICDGLEPGPNHIFDLLHSFVATPWFRMNTWELWKRYKNYTNAQNQSTTYDGVKLSTCCLPPSGSGTYNSLPLHIGHQIPLMPKPQVGEGWNTKQGNLICNCFIIYVSEDPLVISIFVSSIYQMHPRTFIQPQTPNIYLMNIQPTTLLCFSLINFCSSQGTRCSASLASCGLRLNVIEAHVRAASQSSYHVSCHPLGRIGKKLMQTKLQ